MAKRKPARYMKFFDSHEDQSKKDLEYGAQKEGCKKRGKLWEGYEDPSFSGDWTPEED